MPGAGDTPVAKPSASTWRVKRSSCACSRWLSRCSSATVRAKGAGQAQRFGHAPLHAALQPLHVLVQRTHRTLQRRLVAAQRLAHRVRLLGVGGRLHGREARTDRTAGRTWGTTRDLQLLAATGGPRLAAPKGRPKGREQGGADPESPRTGRRMGRRGRVGGTARSRTPRP